MKEKALDRRMVCATVDIDVCKKVERKYRTNATDSFSAIFARALEDATRDVVLTAKDYKDIAAEIERNRKAREVKRNRNTSK
jgi:DNA-binding transcriptional regulator GbsR (MarR family)